MAGAYPKAVIERVRKETDIVELVRENVPGLHSKPGNGDETFLARCPFHREKTPSFMVSRSRQIFHCFGDESGGDAIRFVQMFFGLDFEAALELLARRAGIELPPRGGKDRG